MTDKMDELIEWASAGAGASINKSTIDMAVEEIKKLRKERNELREALMNIRKRCFDDSEYARYIDKLLKKAGEA